MAAATTSIGSLNPPKTLIPNKLSSLGQTPLYSIPKLNLKSRSLTKICASTMSDQNQKVCLDSYSNRERREQVMDAIKSIGLGNCLSETNLHLTVPALKSKTRGKVRDIYDAGDYLVMVTTDRQSAFDRVLASIPFKGQVLNETSLWWFDQTQHITPNAIVSSPDRNVTIAKKCSVFPVEFVVRGYVTGSTDTSLWTVYKSGVRNYCGNLLPDGLVKSQRLPTNILTPTTKAADHDVPVTPDEIVKSGLMTKDEYDEASWKALSLFEYGQTRSYSRSRIVSALRQQEKRASWAINASVIPESKAPTSSTVNSASEGIVIEPDTSGGDIGSANGSGDSGGGGNNWGNNNEGEGESEQSGDSKKKLAMSMSQKLTLGYAALVGLGGLMGYVKSGSQKSLISGGISAAVLFYVYTLLPTNPIVASSVGFGMSAALLGVMGTRFKNSGKIFPAGVVSVVSFIMTGGYLHGIMRGMH